MRLPMSELVADDFPDLASPINATIIGATDLIGLTDFATFGLDLIELEMEVEITIYYVV